MISTPQTTLDFILNGLFSTYAERVPAVQKITQAMLEINMIQNQKDIINDHIAFRTLGIKHLGISSFEKIFLHQGYTRCDHYSFDQKKLDAYWYQPPSNNYPRVFISELRVHELSTEARNVLHRYTDSIYADPVDSIDLNDADQVVEYLHQPLWQLPSYDDYKILLNESEYAAWVLYNRYYLNHYTISVHNLPKGYNTLEEFNLFLKSIQIPLNDSGGEIKVSSDGLLRQSSTVSEMVLSLFNENKKYPISGSYVEFAERLPLKEYQHLPASELKNHHRREGFEVNNADKIFESTYSSQTNKSKN